MKKHISAGRRNHVALCGQSNPSLVSQEQWIVLADKQQCKRCKREREKRAHTSTSNEAIADK